MPRKKRKSLVPADPPKSSKVKHYCLQVIIALGFKIDNERAVQFRKWANQIVGDKGLSRRLFMSDYDRYLLELEAQTKKQKETADGDEE